MTDGRPTATGATDRLTDVGPRALASRWASSGHTRCTSPKPVIPLAEGPSWHAARPAPRGLTYVVADQRAYGQATHLGDPPPRGQARAPRRHHAPPPNPQGSAPPTHTGAQGGARTPARPAPQGTDIRGGGPAGLRAGHPPRGPATPGAGARATPPPRTPANGQGRLVVT